ncbi:MAG: lipid IV(A) 3-deoxy-D-manno-octulosonic acid transferase [Burkholderiales bacterium]
MRALYTAAWWLAAALAPVKLWWRGRREPGYREHVGERYGRYAGPSPVGDDDEVIWIHAVSVGETRAAGPLVDQIARARPNARIVATSMTATGRETARSLWGDRVHRAWLPYDLPGAMRRFLERYHPRAGLLMETELWPNLAAEARRAGVPLFLVNARLSERSATGYARVPALVRPMLESLAGVAAQTAADAARLRALGAREVVIAGNVKFDVAAPADASARAADLRRSFGPRRPVFLAASTRDGEEALIIDALLRDPLPGESLALIVPRHPQRFDEVGSLLAARGLAFARRSDGGAVAAGTTFVLGDTMGELAAYYGAADVAYVGGSLVPLGGQNLIEAIAAGTPVLVGPHTFNFADAAQGAIDAGAAMRVADAAALVRTAGSLIGDPAGREVMREAGRAFLARHRGATARTWAYVEARLAGRRPPG